MNARDRPSCPGSARSSIFIHLLVHKVKEGRLAKYGSRKRPTTSYSRTPMPTHGRKRSSRGFAYERLPRFPDRSRWETRGSEHTAPKSERQDPDAPGDFRGPRELDDRRPYAGHQRQRTAGLRSKESERSPLASSPADGGSRSGLFALDGNLFERSGDRFDHRRGCSPLRRDRGSRGARGGFEIFLEFAQLGIAEFAHGTPEREKVSKFFRFP